MNLFRAFMKVSGYGAAFFWFPDTFLHILWRHEFGWLQVLLITILSSVSTLWGLHVVARERPDDKTFLPIAFICGIWLSAGFFIGLNGMFTGVGFKAPAGWTILFTGMVPPVAFLMSAYDGTLWALSLVTPALLYIWIRWLFHI